MLARLNKEVHKLAGEGHFVESEVDSLAKFIKKKQVTLDTCVRLCHCARAPVCSIYCMRGREPWKREELHLT